MSEEKFYLCLDIGGTKLLGVVFNKNNEIVFEEKVKTEAHVSTDKVERNIYEVLDKLFHYANSKGTALSITLGVPGIVNRQKGEIVFSPNIKWTNYPILEKVKERYNLPCFIDNDVNLGLLGEWKYGQKKNYKNCLGIFIGTGIGGGIVVNNQPYTGANSWAGEFGHIIIETDGEKCACGKNGCLEAMTGKTAMTNYVKAQIQLGRKTHLSDTMDKNGLVRGKSLKNALEQNDVVAKEVIERSARYLAKGVGILINIFNPDAIIFGGGIVEATKDYMLPEIIKNTPLYCVNEIFKSTDIIKAELGDYSVVYGAMAYGMMAYTTEFSA